MNPSERASAPKAAYTGMPTERSASAVATTAAAISAIIANFATPKGTRASASYGTKSYGGKGAYITYCGFDQAGPRSTRCSHARMVAGSYGFSPDRRASPAQ